MKAPARGRGREEKGRIVIKNKRNGRP